MRAFVTGANRGLGLEFVRQMAERADRVFATCRQPDAAAALQKLKAQHPDLISITRLDVADPESIEASYRVVSQETDALDVLINNAGMAPGGDTLRGLTQEKLIDTFAVNAAGPILVARRYLDLIKNGENPRIVNISSGLGSLASRDSGGWYSYCASKAALNMLTRTLMHDLKKDRITAIVMDPDWVRTDMGGRHASITPAESIGGMLEVIDGLTLAQSGRFFHYTGSEEEW